VTVVECLGAYNIGSVGRDIPAAGLFQQVDHHGETRYHGYQGHFLPSQVGSDGDVAASVLHMERHPVERLKNSFFLFFVK
jgi:hypothetical protein